MKEAGEDWLSCTMRTVERVMKRHGFEAGEPKIVPPKPIIDEQLSSRDKILRAGFLFRASKSGSAEHLIRPASETTKFGTLLGCDSRLSSEHGRW